jgi:hypothetical protein
MMLYDVFIATFALVWAVIAMVAIFGKKRK